MSVSIPLEPTRWERFRVLYRQTWGGTGSAGASGGGWTVQIMQQPAPETSGFVLIGYSRALLPQLGTATLLFRYGQIGSRVIGSSAESMSDQQQGQQWDAETSLTGVPDLAGYEILIQAAEAFPDSNPASEDEPSWQLVWWGTCEYQTDEGWGASPVPAGQRTYHCIDALHRLKRWPLDQHGFVGDGITIAPAKGNPGYNFSRETSRLQGNRDSTGATFTTRAGGTALMHSLPGAGTTWTDLQVINNVLAIARPPGQPLWTLTGATDLFGGTSSWPVQDGDTAWDMLVRIVDRGRGRGAVRCEFTQASPTGSVVPFLKAYAQLYDDVSIDEPAGSQVTFAGASSNGTAVEVDLIGDHRHGSLELGQAEQYQVDYLESQGEPIEVLVTLSYEDETLEIGWKPSQETAFRALDPENRTEDKWADVLQFHRLMRGFTGSVGNGNGGTTTRCDYRCDDDGDVILPTENDTSPAMIQILDDTPLFLGYDYTSTPARYDGDAASAFAGDPARKPPRYFLRTASEEFLEFKELTEGFSVRLHPDGFHIAASRDNEGRRYFNAGTAGNLSSAHHYNKIVITCAIRLPHRVRMSTGNIETAKRKKTIMHDGLHLWMAHQGAIWDLNSSARTTGDGSAPKRAASPSTSPAGILRDDRNALARLHALAVAWYGPLRTLLGQQQGTEPIRRGASWSLRCCGDIASSADRDGGGVVYPDVGKVVSYLRANGQRIRLMTPVSSFVYDNLSGTTTWTTDWQDLDFRRVGRAL